MKRNKKVLSLVAALASVALFATHIPGFSALAAEKKNVVSSEIDDIRWVKQGNEAVYTINDAVPYYAATPGANVISSSTTVKGDQSVYAEIWFKDFGSDYATTQLMFQPYSTTQGGVTDVMYTTAERTIGQHSSTGNYSDWVGGWAYGGDWGSRTAAAGTSGWERKPEFLTGIRYVGRPDGSVSYYIWEQDEANRTDVLAWRESYRTHAAGADLNYFPAPDATADYYTLVQIVGACLIEKMSFGTIVESADDLASHIMTEKTVLTEIVGTDKIDDGTVIKASEPGKIYVSGGTISASGQQVITNPAKEDMLYAAMPVHPDPITDNVFSVNATLSIPTLSAGRKVGLGITQMDAAGLNANPVDSEGSSFIYFENVEGVNYIGLMNDGAAVGAPVALTADVSAPFSFKAHVTKDGKAVINVGEQEIVFENVVVEGTVAFAALGEGDLVLMIEPEVEIIRYSYLTSEGESMECNFNEYCDPSKFFIDTHSTAGYADPQEAVGLYQADDGTLFFEGSGTNATFSPIGMYADFVVEFDYISYPIEERPELAAGIMHGYSDLSISFGNETPYGWGRGEYQLFIRDYSTRQWVTADEPYQGYGSIKLHNWNLNKQIGDEIFISNGSDVVDEATGIHTYTSVANEGYLSLYACTTKIKLVVADNVAVLYGCTMIEGKALSEYTAADYVELGRWELPSTLSGRVSLNADEAGYYKVDNFRITRLDGDKVSDVQDNLAAYVDFKEIADDPRPTVIAKPALSIEGNVVSWAAVEGATGYAVSVNGGEDIAVEGTSYTVTETEAGEYEIKVKAIGDGNKLLDSGYASISYVVGGEEEPNPPTSGDNNSSGDSSSAEEGGSCSSSVSATLGAVALIAMAGAVISLKKKRD